jgi:MFS family permease
MTPADRPPPAPGFPAVAAGEVGARRSTFPTIAVAAAAAAMVATLPGRTHGLGLVTEPLLADLQLDRVAFATLNFWATLIGAAFCVPAGWLLDRLGVRAVLVGVLLALAAVVVGMSRLPAGGSGLALPVADVFSGRGIEWAAVPAALFVLVLLTRGLGQSALSVVSLALVGKAAGRRPGLVMGVYSFLVAVGFMAAFRLVQGLDKEGAGWRDLWAGIGWAVAGLGVVAAIVVRSPAAASPDTHAGDESAGGHTLAGALRTPAFWLFALATSFYGLVTTGVSLFGQSLLEERGFDRQVFLTITAISPMVGLAANLATGWLATRVRLGWLLAGSLVVLTAALLAFPNVATLPQVYAYAVAMGVAGGMITVIFFTVWRQFYGTAHLGKIQGAAQLLTVLASAAGPVILAAGQRASGSYAPVIEALAVVSALFAALALIVPMPSKERPA